MRIKKEKINHLRLAIRLSGALLITAMVNINAVAEKNYSKGIETVTVQQQERTVTGVITDESGKGVEGVTVLIKGTTQGAITGANGSYSVKVPNSESVLRVSFIGMITEEVTVEDKKEINIQLKSDTISLGEVVAVGYASQKKSDVTGAVTSISTDNFNKGSAQSAGQLIQGKVSGVNVTSSSGAPGSGQKIIIRGQGTVRSGAGPLFVIDGFPYGLAGTGSDTSPLNFINPEDIETMTVLKDASATAIYGARGANGVILITTKSGKKGKTNIMVLSNTGVSKMTNKLPIFSADEFREKVVEIGGVLKDGGGDTDWQEALTRTAITQDYNLIMSGGTENFTYRASLGYLDQEGILMESGLERYSGRINATQSIVDGKLKIDFNLTSTIEKSENANSSTTLSNMLTFNPTYEAYDESGEPTKFVDYINPISDALLNKTFGETRTIMVGITPSIQLYKGLVYKLNFGYKNRSNVTDDQEMPSVDPYIKGSLTQSNSRSYSTLIENYITYKYESAEHNFNALVGHSYQKDDSYSNSWSIENFEANGIEPRSNPGLGQEMTLGENRPSGSAGVNELQSYFGRATYNNSGKYMVTGTLRVDGSSKFGSNNRYGYFPSFAGGWRVSEEAFMADGIFDNLKLRAGWGQTGNQEIPSKITQESYTSSNGGDATYPLNDSDLLPVGTSYTRLANPDIQWEVSTQTNIGIDFGFLGNTLTGTIDYFNKVSDNILIEVTSFDPISPAPTYWTNVDDMTITNQGVELALDYRHDSKSGLSYSVGANATFLDNVVEDSPFSIITTGSASGSGLTGATINGMINGHPIGSFYMKEFMGIGSDGLSIYKEAEEEGAENKFVVGSALPKVLYSFNANFNYKRFNLGLNFNGVSGNKIFNNTALSKFYKAQLAVSNNTTDLATEYPEEALTNSVSVSTRYLENGSFLRLSNATLGYDLDTERLGINEWAKSIKFTLTGQNLFVITDYSGYDPEVNEDKSTDGVQSFGIDDNSYPKARTFTLGVNVNF